MPKIFVSHSRYDSEFCNRFDSACAQVGLARFRSEFENIRNPAWKTINREIKKSNALFLLVGRKLVKRQSITDKGVSSSDWTFTQNWISYEIGVASQLRMDVWVVCDVLPINFPVPYLNNYVVSEIDLTKHGDSGFFCGILEFYARGGLYGLHKKLRYSCPDCGATYNLWMSLPKDAQIVCPTCLKVQNFPEGRLLEPPFKFPAPIVSIIDRKIRKP